jgi:hypothetical protein
MLADTAASIHLVKCEMNEINDTVGEICSARMQHVPALGHSTPGPQPQPRRVRKHCARQQFMPPALPETLQSLAALHCTDSRLKEKNKKKQTKCNKNRARIACNALRSAHCKGAAVEN